MHKIKWLNTNRIDKFKSVFIQFFVKVFFTFLYNFFPSVSLQI